MPLAVQHPYSLGQHPNRAGLAHQLPLNSTAANLSHGRVPQGPSPKFGAMGVLEAGYPAISGFMHFLDGNRTQAMILEDLVGFGFMRTGLDMYRGKMYGNGDWNFVAGRERILREIFSIFTDNISSGLVAYGLARLILDRGKRADVQAMTSFQTMDVFKNVLTYGNPQDKAQFLKELLSNLHGHAENKQVPIGKVLQEHIDLKTLDDFFPQAAAKEPWHQRFMDSLPFIGKKSSAVAQTAEESLPPVTQFIKTHLPQLDSHDVQYIRQFVDEKGVQQTIQEHLNLTELLQDAKRFLEKVPTSATFVATESSPWRQEALGFLKRTMNGKYIQLAALSVGLLSTVAVAPFNNWITKTFDKIDFYPAELGLRPKDKAKAQASPYGVAPNSTRLQKPFSQTAPWLLSQGTYGANGLQGFGAMAQGPHFGSGWSSPLGPVSAQDISALMAGQSLPIQSPNQSTDGNRFQKWFPYLSDCVEKGKWGQVLLTMAPLPVVLGLFDTVNKKFVNPFKGNFPKYLRNAYQFQKGFPFTTQQQIATLFAALIISRMASARGPNEFRERTIDGFAGWGLWILGTPVYKQIIANALDSKVGTALLKQINGQQLLKSGEDMLLLGADKLKKTKIMNTWLSFGSLAITLLLMGIVEPLIAMKWTQHNGVKEGT